MGLLDVRKWIYWVHTTTCHEDLQLYIIVRRSIACVLPQKFPKLQLLWRWWMRLMFPRLDAANRESDLPASQTEQG